MPADFLTRNMFFREAEQDTPAQGLSGAGFTGNPQQLLSMLQSPEIQQQLQHFGIHFNPQQVQQSPFFPNSMMQGHPRLGGALSGAMANAAMTPEAPLVSGAGSGISRAMQGMAGGPEMQRQFQLRQLMAPFQAVGMQLPMMGEQRRQQLLQALMEDMQNRQGQTEEAESHKMQMAQMKQQIEQQKLESQRPTMGPYGMITPIPQEPQFQSPQGMPAELGGQMTGVPQLPQDAQMLPGGHFAFQPYTQQQVGNVAQGKETPATTKLKNAQATRQNAEAGKASQQGKLAGARAGQVSGAGAAKLDAWSQDRNNKIEADLANKLAIVDANQKMDPATKKQIKDNLIASANQQKQNIQSGYQTGMGHLGQGGQGAKGQAGSKGGDSNVVPKGTMVYDPQGNPHSSDGTHPLPQGWSTQAPKGAPQL